MIICLENLLKNLSITRKEKVSLTAGEFYKLVPPLEKQKLEEKYKNDDDSQEDSQEDSEEDEIEDEIGQLITPEIDAQIIKTIGRISDACYFLFISINVLIILYLLYCIYCIVYVYCTIIVLT